MKGSDHCPVFVDFHNEITASDGSVIKLHDVLGVKAKPDGTKEPPRLAAKFWEEYSGKQMLLDKFFGKGKKSTAHAVAVSPTPQPSNDSEQLEGTQGSQSPSDTPTVDGFPVEPMPVALHDLHATTSPDPPASSPTEMACSPPITTSQTLKRKSTIDGQLTPATSKKQKSAEKKTDKKAKSRSGQPKLSSFFNKPIASQTSSSSAPKEKSQTPIDVVDVDDDDVSPLSQEPTAPSQDSLPVSVNGEAKQVWNNLLAPVQPPKCIVHGEPAKEYTVNKPGPNKGKRFFICSRYVVRPLTSIPRTHRDF